MAREPAFVLVVDDDDVSTRAVRARLVAAGALTASCGRADAAAEALAFHRPHAVVVDLAMEGERGWEVLRQIRASGAAVIALDRTCDPQRRRAAFAAGADEVVEKPVDPDEVAARALALAARARSDVVRRIYRRNGLVLDADARMVTVDGCETGLTPQQLTILEALFEAGGTAVSRSLLADRIGGMDDEPPSDRAVDLHVSRLRRRLGGPADLARFIEAVPGIGYRLAAPTAPSAPVSHDAVAVLDAVPQPILLVGADLAVRHANAAARALTGLAAVELAGRRCGDVLDCRDTAGAELLPRCLGRVALGGEVPLTGVTGTVASPDGRLEVTFSCARVRAASGDELAALTVRPRLPLTST